MRRSGSLLLALLALAGPAGFAGTAQGAGPSPVRGILPVEGLIAQSVVEFRDQAALDPHYFLADETALGLDGKAAAVFARYGPGGAEALVLAVAYPDADAAGRVHERFGRDFFSQEFDPKPARFVERLESGDFAGIARAGPVLVVVLEASSRKGCDDLLRRLEANAKALY